MENGLESDNIFFEEIKKGHKWQLWVGAKLRERGFEVRVPDLVIRPDRDLINEYTDRGDIFVIVGEKELSIEVKSRSIKFYDKDSYPYPTAFVDRVKTWERKQGNVPACIILVSQITGGMVAVSTSEESRKKWFVSEERDTKRDYVRDYYMVEKEELREFEDLVNWLGGTKSKTACNTCKHYVWKGLTKWCRFMDCEIGELWSVGCNNHFNKYVKH